MDEKLNHKLHKDSSSITESADESTGSEIASKVFEESQFAALCEQEKDEVDRNQGEGQLGGRIP